MGILICGLNGVGKSTLGTALASRLGYEFIDNEDLFFPKVDLEYEYSNPRTKEEVSQLLEKKINNNSLFVFLVLYIIILFLLFYSYQTQNNIKIGYHIDIISSYHKNLL